MSHQIIAIEWDVVALLERTRSEIVAKFEHVRRLTIGTVFCGGKVGGVR